MEEVEEENKTDLNEYVLSFSLSGHDYGVCARIHPVTFSPLKNNASLWVKVRDVAAHSLDLLVTLEERGRLSLWRRSPGGKEFTRQDTPQVIFTFYLLHQDATV